MGFISGLREALAGGEDAFRALCRDSGDLTKEFENGLKMETGKIGEVAAIDFTRDMRAGEIRETLIKAKPEIAKVATESNAYIISMEREAKDFPEYHISEAAGKQTKLPKTLTGVTSAEELEKVAKTDEGLENALKKAEKKAGSSKKYIFLGAAVIGAVGVYEAVEAYARSKTGCLLYTSDNKNKISVCKVLQASCLNPKESTVISTCSTATMGPDLTKVSCSDWDSTKSACNHCSAETFDYSKLKNSQYLKCQEKADFLDAVGDLFYGMGIDISNSINSLKKIVKWILIGIAIVIVIAVFIWAIRKVTQKNQIQQQFPMYPFPPPPGYGFPPPGYPYQIPQEMGQYHVPYQPVPVYKPVDENVLKYQLLKMQKGVRIDPYSNI